MMGWLEEFVQIWLAGMTAVITTWLGIHAGWRWIRKYFDRKFAPPPLLSVVTSEFSYQAVLAGIDHLVDRARAFAPDEIVAINRGGLIIGAMLGKHLGIVPRAIEIDLVGDAIWFDAPERLKGKSVLLVDDRLTDGKHMDAAYKCLKEYATEVSTYVFAYVKRPQQNIVPQQWPYEAKSKDVLFPWEPAGGAEPIRFARRKDEQATTISAVQRAEPE